MSRFVASKVAVVSAIAIIIILGFAFLGPIFYPVNPAAMNEKFIGLPMGIPALYNGSEEAPPTIEQSVWEDPATDQGEIIWELTKAHPLGVDNQGRDMLARVLGGARISLTVGIVSCIINLFIGLGVGLTAGWAKGSGTALGEWIDNLLMRTVDVLYSIPLLLVVVLIQLFARPLLDSGTTALFGGNRDNVPMLLTPELMSIYLALGVINWLMMARLVRGEVLNQVNMEYVMAAHSLGQKTSKILYRHVLPNVLGPVAVATTLAIPEAIFIESFLGFVGLGVTAPQASWGTMANDSLAYLRTAPHMLLLPAIAISVTMLAFNLFGDGLRDAITPSKKK